MSLRITYFTRKRKPITQGYSSGMKNVKLNMDSYDAQEADMKRLGIDVTVLMLTVCSDEVYYCPDRTLNLNSSFRSKYTTLSLRPASITAFLKSDSGDINTS